jgi:prepilin-type N-terminal cleavage/methylation domain-containing protein
MNTNIGHSASPHSASGFTLLELLIAIMILAILVGIVYSSFASVTSTMEMARDAADRLRFRQIVWRSLSTNLQSIYVDAGCLQSEYQFLGENKDGGLGPADSLRYTSSLPLPGAGALPGISKIITCQVVDRNEVDSEVVNSVPYDEERPGSILMIHEEPLKLESQDFVTETQNAEWDVYEQAVPVASMDILYFDGLQKEWVEEWDSLAQRRLPGGITVKINFPRSEEERAEAFKAGIDLQKNPDLEITMSLPLGRDVEFPFPDFNNLRLNPDDMLEEKK